MQVCYTYIFSETGHLGVGGLNTPAVASLGAMVAWHHVLMFVLSSNHDGGLGIPACIMITNRFTQIHAMWLFLSFFTLNFVALPHFLTEQHLILIMADTAPKIAEAEIAESDDVIEAQATKLAELIRDSKHFIAFTGAGVSTSAGIADFRGPQGVWTLRAQGRDDEIESKDTLQAIPTPTHMALVELQDRGVLKYLVSQNCDGLHRRSGILPDRISELHGNSNKEWCRDGCGQEYIRGKLAGLCLQSFAYRDD